MRLTRTSVTRIVDFSGHALATEPVPRTDWSDGDYVVAEVIDGGVPSWHVESPSGRAVSVGCGDLVVGALGVRLATLEAVGDWRDVGDDLEMSTLTRGGVFGRCTSVSHIVRPQLIPLRYRGHLTLDGRGAVMSDHGLPAVHGPLTLPPVILLIGTSMSSGKTTAGVAITRVLSRRGLRVGAVKLTGIGRYADILAMRDAGACAIADFVDAGLPSTVASEPVVTDAARRMKYEGHLSRHWETISDEANGFWNAIYASRRPLEGRVPDDTRRNLRAFPTSPILAPFDYTAHPAAHELVTLDRFDRPHNASPLPISSRSRADFLWKHSAYALRGRPGEDVTTEPTSGALFEYLLAYWMLRAHAPEVVDG